MKFIKVLNFKYEKMPPDNTMINLDTITSIHLDPWGDGLYSIKMSHDSVSVSKADLDRVLAAIRE